MSYTMEQMMLWYRNDEIKKSYSDYKDIILPKLLDRNSQYHKYLFTKNLRKEKGIEYYIQQCYIDIKYELCSPDENGFNISLYEAENAKHWFPSLDDKQIKTITDWGSVRCKGESGSICIDGGFTYNISDPKNKKKLEFRENILKRLEAMMFKICLKFTKKYRKTVDYLNSKEGFIEWAIKNNIKFGYDGSIGEDK